MVDICIPNEADECIQHLQQHHQIPHFESSKKKNDKELLALLAATSSGSALSASSFINSKAVSIYFKEVHSIADHLTNLVQKSEQLLHDTNFAKSNPGERSCYQISKESSDLLANHILSIMKKLDYYLAEKNDLYGADLGIGYMALICGLIFIERLPEGTLTKNNIFPAVGVAMGLGIKALFDEHPTNNKFAHISGVESLRKYNGIEVRFCKLVNFNFAINDEIVNLTKKRFSNTTNACAA